MVIRVLPPSCRKCGTALDDDEIQAGVCHPCGGRTLRLVALSLDLDPREPAPKEPA